jgi:hypothetical protein
VLCTRSSEKGGNAKSDNLAYYVIPLARSWFPSVPVPMSRGAIPLILVR